MLLRCLNVQLHSQIVEHILIFRLNQNNKCFQFVSMSVFDGWHIWSGYYAADMNCSSHRIGFDKQSLAKTISHKVYFLMHIPPILYHECWILWYLEDPIIFNEYPGLTPTLCQIAFHSCNCAMWLWCNSTCNDGY